MNGCTSLQKACINSQTWEGMHAAFVEIEWYKSLLYENGSYFDSTMEYELSSQKNTEKH